MSPIRGLIISHPKISTDEHQTITLIYFSFCCIFFSINGLGATAASLL